MGNRARWAIAVCLCVALCCVLLWNQARRRGSDRQKEHGASHSSQPDESPPSQPDESPPSQPDESPPRAEGPSESSRNTENVTFTMGRPNPIIDRVRVDKLEMCIGEENFAYPDIHTVDGTEADLRISLSGVGFVGAGSTGAKLPFRFLRPMDEHDMPIVVVQGAGGTHAEQQLPFIKVRDCDTVPLLKVDMQRVPGQGPDVFSFRVTGAPDGSQFVWDFGDGTPVSTGEPGAVHDFHNRPQRTRFSEVLVTIRATAPGGHTYQGSRTLELFNSDYWQRRSRQQQGG